MDDTSRAAADIARFSLAISDLEDVADIAQLVADHDPDLQPFGPFKPMAEALRVEGPRGQALANRAEAVYRALGNFKLRAVVETGLIVTYARPFTRGDSEANGERRFPLDTDTFVPAERREFHRLLMDMRDQAHAHSDGTADVHLRRSAECAAGPGSWGVLQTGPRRLSPQELSDLADFAREIIERLSVARDAARAVLDDRTTHTPMHTTPRAENAP